MEEKKKTTAAKATESAKEVRKFIKSAHLRGHEAKQKGQKVAWCMWGLPPEPVVAMDIIPLWPEPFASLCSAKKVEGAYLDKARAEGYSLHSCGYCETGLGYAQLTRELGAIPPGAPDGGMAIPDMLLTVNLLCDSRQKFFQGLGRYLDAPMYCVDRVFPHDEGSYGDDITKWDALKYGDVNTYIKRRGYDYYIDYRKEELKRFIAFLEKVCGRKMDYDRLNHVVDVTHQTFKLWHAITEMSKAIPCPLPAGDYFSAFYPSWWRPGEDETLEYFRKFYQEMKYRVDNKISAVPEEKYRLLWASGIPFWHSMYMFNYFETKFNSVVICPDVYAGIGRPIDVADPDPITAMAIRDCLFESYQRFAYTFPERLMKWVEEYQVDGLLWHQTMSCRVASIGHFFSKMLVEEKVKLPSLFLESDLVDSRSFNEADFKAKIDAFMETVANVKEKRKMV